MNSWEFKEQGLKTILYAIEEISDGEFRYHIKYQNSEHKSVETYPERQQAYDAAVEKARAQNDE